MTSLTTTWTGRFPAWRGWLRWIWLVAPAAVWLLDFSRDRHNTYKIYKHVCWHLLEGRNLYLPYPEKFGDVNLYGPFFGLVMAPFAALPDVAGGLAWNVLMGAALYLAIGRLGLAPERRVLLMLVCTLELLNALWSNQFNPAMAALLVLTFAFVEEGHDFLAPLWILAGAFVKIYSAVGLVFLLFARDKRAFLAGCLAWSGVLLVAPVIISSPEFVLQSYQDWFQALVAKNAHNVQLYTSQDISIPGLIRRAIGLPISSAWFYLAGLPLLLAPLARRGQYPHRTFRVLVLASLLMFIVLFSSGSESSTYVICAVGAGLWMAQQTDPFRPRNLVLLAGLLLAGLAPTDLLSVPVRVFTNRHALKAIPYAVIWLLLCRDLLTRDFGRDAAFLASPDGMPQAGEACATAGAGLSSARLLA
jgi:hypothetical protein